MRIPNLALFYNQKTGEIIKLLKPEDCPILLEIEYRHAQRMNGCAVFIR